MKTNLICVSPKSSRAKICFEDMMNSLHTCRIEERKNGKMFLASISGKFWFWMSEGSDDHWEVVK